MAVSPVASRILDAYSAYWDGFSNFMADFGLQGTLIVLTLIVTLFSYRSQLRAGVREAIEQIDARNSEYRVFRRRRGPGHRKRTRGAQTKPAVADFNLLHRDTQVAFYSNRISSNSDRVVGHTVPPYYLTILPAGVADGRPLNERILEHETISDVKRDSEKIVIKCDSINPVECREAASHVLDEMDNSKNSAIRKEQFNPRHRGGS